MLYPLGACRPASRICLKSSAGIGVPSKLGVALRSWIAWLNVFFNLFIILFSYQQDASRAWETVLVRCSSYSPAETILKIALPRQTLIEELKMQPSDQ